MGMEDETYGYLDDYVDNLLGIPQQDRGADALDFQKNRDAEAPLPESSLPKPNIIYADGRKGPAESEVQPKKVSSEASQKLMGGVINGWASLDAEVIETKVAEDGKAAPKRKAERP